MPIFSEETETGSKIIQPELITDTKQRTNQIVDVKIIHLLNYIRKKIERDILKTTLDPIALSAIFIVLFLLGIYIMSFLLRIFLLKYLLKQISRKNKLIQKELNQISNNIFPLLVVLGVRLALVILETLFDTILPLLKSLLNAGIIILLSMMLKRIVMSLVYIWSNQLSSVHHQKMAKQLLPLTVGLSKFVIFSFGLILTLAFLGVNIAPFIASLGALTFAIGFAVKDSLSNFVAGILLIIDDSFLVGDKIDVPEIGLGHIHEIRLRTTRILTYDNEVVVIPNNILMNKEYKNFRLPDETIRIVVDFSVAYGSKVDQVRETILSVLTNDSEILTEPPPVVEFVYMADCALNFKAKGYVNNYDNQYTKMIELTEKIYNALNEKNISIPFPTHTVYFKKQA